MSSRKPGRLQRTSARSKPLDRLETAALRYLARRERHEGQVRAHLERAGASPSQIRTLLSRFRRLGYLDDRGYARRWIEARLQRKPMGRERAEAELLAKGFDPSVLRETLDEVYREQDERRLAQSLLHQGGYDRQDGPIARMAALLRRHGFTDETIESVLEECRRP
jgi:regulatory protein